MVSIFTKSYYNELIVYKLSLVNVIAPANACIFPEYIIPNIQPLVHDPEVSVRSLYAQCIVPLADIAVRYLEMGQALKAHGTFKVAADTVEYDEAQFEVSPFVVSSWLSASKLSGSIRRSPARFAELCSRTSCVATCRFIQCCQARCPARCLVHVHLPWTTTHERYLVKPYDHVPQRPRLAHPIRLLRCHR